MANKSAKQNNILMLSTILSFLFLICSSYAVTYNSYTLSWPTSGYVRIISDGTTSSISDSRNDIIAIDYQQNRNTGFGFFRIHLRNEMQNCYLNNRYFLYIDTNDDGENDFLLYNTTVQTRSLLCSWYNVPGGTTTRWSDKDDTTPPTYGYQNLVYNASQNDNYIELAVRLSHIGSPVDIIQAAASGNPGWANLPTYNNPENDPLFEPGVVTPPGQAGVGSLAIVPQRIGYNSQTTYAIVTVLDANVTNILFEWLSEDTVTVISSTTVAVSGLGSSTSAMYISGGSDDRGMHFCRATFSDPTTIIGSKLRPFMVNNQQPNAVTLFTPANQNISHNSQPQFFWSSATDPDGDEIVYILQVSTNSTFENSLTINTTLSSSETTFNVTESMLPDKFYWRVLTQDSLLERNTSLSYWFIVFDTTQRRIVTETGSVTFYLGTWESSEDYLPVTLNVNSLSGIDTVTITVFDGKHPDAMDADGELGDLYFLSRWFRIDHTGGIGSGNLTFVYTDADFADAGSGAFSESDMQIARYHDGIWTWFNADARDTAANWVQINNVTEFSDWSLSGPGGVPVELSYFEALPRKR